MKHQFKISKHSIVFSKWTRKRYAAFASLGKLVKIARLSVDAFKSLLTQNKPIQLLLGIGQKNDELDEEDYMEKSTLLEEVFTQLLLALKISCSKETISSKLNSLIRQSPYFT